MGDFEVELDGPLSPMPARLTVAATASPKAPLSSCPEAPQDLRVPSKLVRTRAVLIPLLSPPCPFRRHSSEQISACSSYFNLSKAKRLCPFGSPERGALKTRLAAGCLGGRGSAARGGATTHTPFPSLTLSVYESSGRSTQN